MVNYLNKEAFADMEEEVLDDDAIDEILKKIEAREDGRVTWKAFLKFNQEIHKKFI